MTGIELLQMIKNNEVEEGTDIDVLRVNEESCCFDVVAKLKYNNNDLLWSPGTFRSSMLWDNDYFFEIIESLEMPDKIEELKIKEIKNVSGRDVYYYYGSENKEVNKINELIKAVNYLLDEKKQLTSNNYYS